jgi:outer membrane protein TolC
MMTILESRTRFGLALTAILAMASPLRAEPPLTVDQAVEEALANHPSLKAASSRAEQAKATHDATWETYAPQVSVFGGVQRNEVSGETTTTTPGSILTPPTTVTQNFSESDTQLLAGGQVQEFLFDFGGFTGQRNATDATHRAQLAALETQRLDISANVRVAYFNLLRANRLLRYNQGTAESREKRVKRIADLARRGTRERKDMLQAQLDFANARLNLARSQSEITEVEAVFLDAIGARSRESRKLVDDVSFKPVHLTLPQAIERGLKQRPEVEQTKASIESQEAQIDVVRASYWPRVSAFAGITNLEGTGSSDLDRLTVYTGGLSMNVPTGWIFSRPRLAQAEATLQELKARERELEQSITLGVSRSYTALFEAIERSKVTQQLAEDALANWKEIQGRYRKGRASILENTDAYRFLYDARVSLIQALYDAKIAEARLERAVGGGL